MTNITAGTNRRFVAIRRPLPLILILALALRLIYGLAQDPLAVYSTSGDTGWYLLNGYALATGFDQGTVVIPALPHVVLQVSLQNLPTPPLYLLFIGFWQAVLPPAAAIVMIRLVQAVMGVALCAVAYRLARWLGGDRAGLWAAGALAVSPAFVIEPAALLSETLYMFLVSAGLWVYVRLFALERAGTRRRVSVHMLAAGGLLGLATLTRAPLLLFPLGLVLHGLLVCGWREGLRRAALLLAAYTLIVSTWTLYNLARWDRFIIAAPGFEAFLFLSTVDWQGPQAVDQSLAEITGANVPDQLDDQQQIYRDAAAQSISRDLPGYLRRRVGDLADAYLQPHGTAYLGGESLKDLALRWLQTDRTPGGLLRLTQADWFWPKLVMYGFHYTGLALGLVGLWLARRRWRLALPLLGFIVYTTLVHFVLDALPRYVFPTMLFWWVFAAVALGAWRFKRAAAAP